MEEPPGPAFERYLAEVERTHPPRPQYQPGPPRWWYWLAPVVTIGGVFALEVWKVGQAFGAW